MRTLSRGMDRKNPEKLPARWNGQDSGTHWTARGEQEMKAVPTLGSSFSRIQSLFRQTLETREGELMCRSWDGET